MTNPVAAKREQLVALCRKYRVTRLDVFGSGARDDFDEHSSDVDLLVEFEDMPFADRGDAYLGLLTDTEALFGRRVDLVEPSPIRNQYLRRSIEASRQTLYAA